MKNPEKKLSFMENSRGQIVGVQINNPRSFEGLEKIISEKQIIFGNRELILKEKNRKINLPRKLLDFLQDLSDEERKEIFNKLKSAINDSQAVIIANPVNLFEEFIENDPRCADLDSWNR